DRAARASRMATVMRTIDLRGSTLSPEELRGVLPRAEVDVGVAIETVRPILDEVRKGGAEALLALTEKFDRVRPDSLRVPAQVIADAQKHLDPGVRDALVESIRRARIAHAAQLPEERTSEVAPGGTVEQRWIPVSRVGLYVPGGLAVYPSSVVMNVVPAQVAAVGALAVASAPHRENGGWPDATILAVCALLGVDDVYAAGGAQADGMFTYGVMSRAADGEVD